MKLDLKVRSIFGMLSLRVHSRNSIFEIVV